MCVATSMNPLNMPIMFFVCCTQSTTVTHYWNLCTTERLFYCLWEHQHNHFCLNALKVTLRHFKLVLCLLFQIGLAVGDIEGVQKNARLKRLAMQVEMVADMEKKLPMIILRCVDKKTVTNHPNDAVSTIRTVSMI